MNQTPFSMIKDNLDPAVITLEVINIINQWLKEENLTQTNLQKQMLFSHVKAIVERAKSLQKLPEVDPSLFEEISEKSMSLARKTVNLFDTLSAEEAYLLAMHYEVARANQE